MGGFQQTAFKNKLTFMKKICTAYNNPMHCKARQVLHDLFGSFSINQRNGSEITFVAGATKVNLKNLKS